MEIEQLNLAADNIRILSAAMVERARSGHPGGAMGGADFINVLYAKFLRYDPDDRQWFMRDRFFLDPGHLSAMLYSILTLTGTFTMDDLKQFRQWGSCTPGHPELDRKRGIENTSGPLGQGHAMAVGSAIAERFFSARFGEWMAHKTYTFISDGGIQEEISQAAGRIAGNLGLNNLIMFYDSNDVQLSTKTWVVSSEDTAMKYRAWGWNVIEIDGNDASQVIAALGQAVNEKQRPTLIIGKTIMGKGALTADKSSFEGQVSTHGMPLSDAGASFEQTIRHLGGEPENPFHIFPKVAEFYADIAKAKAMEAKQRRAKQKEWEQANPEAAKQLYSYLNMELKLDFSTLVQKKDVATRAASSVVLGYLAREVGNMIVASADLANSDKTDGFLKHTRAFARDDFSGAFLQVGVSELTMAAISNGIALHGGIHVCCATFFAFSDYMKPAIRLSALMELPVKYLWTHDAFRVGEDGPTHQPVEHEAQIRLLENLKNHSGKRSTLVLRPADADETTVAWQMAMENRSTPTALILSRQGIKSLPVSPTGSYAKLTENLNRGAYIVENSDEQPKVILVASGSEVSTLVEGAKLLRERKSWKVRVVSVISEGLFRSQSQDYQQLILPDHIPVFGLTAGLPVTLRGLTGCQGTIWGLEHFGYSAPAAKLDEMFGFTPENIYNQVVKMFQPA